jgi:hypothetical protein
MLCLHLSLPFSGVAGTVGVRALLIHITVAYILPISTYSLYHQID